DTRAQVLRLAGGVWPPDRLEDHAVRQYATRVLSEVGEQLEFLGCETNFFAVSQHEETFAVDDQAAPHDGLARGRRIVDAAKRRADAREQLFGSERLGHVIIGPCIASPPFIPLTATSTRHT